MSEARALVADRIFDGERFRDRAAVIVEGERIVDIISPETIPAAARVSELPRRSLLAPGFIDVQVNGGGGVLLNDEPTVSGIRTIASAHRRYGTTGMLPTLISDSRDVMRKAIAAVGDAIREGVPGILGIHLEGPFLNPLRNGAHPKSHIIPIEPDDIELLSSLGSTGTTLVTLAPEKAPHGVVGRPAAARRPRLRRPHRGDGRRHRHCRERRSVGVHASLQCHVAARLPRAWNGRRGAD